MMAFLFAASVVNVLGLWLFCVSDFSCCLYIPLSLCVVRLLNNSVMQPASTH